MLKKILSISGKPGLYRLLSYGKNIIIVEGLADGKRFPVSSRSKVVALGDIAIYTTGDDKPLAEVLKAVGEKYENKPVNAKAFTTKEDLNDFMVEILPDYDVDRVYSTDIKKLISWYNALIAAGITDFTAKEEKGEESAPATGQQ